MQTGDIIFVGGNDLIDEIIRFFDHGDYNHVAMFVSDTEILEAQYNTKVHVVDNFYDGPDYKTIVIPMNLDDEQKGKLEKLKDQYIGEGYDYGDIFIKFLRLEFGINLERFENPNEQICSELVGRLLVGLGLADESVVDMAPNELFRYLKNKGY
jgi:uncharacterized protein YycO